MTKTHDEKIKAALTYFGFFITGIIFLLIEKKNKTIRFHAMQSTLFFIAIILFEIAIGLIPILGRLISFLVDPMVNVAVFIVWLFLMLKAYLGDKYYLPYFGELAEKQLKKLN